LVADDEGDNLDEDERRIHRRRLPLLRADDETPHCDAAAANVRARLATMETTTLHP
jgi:hypothetical protein